MPFCLSVSQAQANIYSTNNEDNNTNVFIDSDPDRQTCEQTSESDG